MSLSLCFCSPKYPSPSLLHTQKFTFLEPTSTLLNPIIPNPRNLSSSRLILCIKRNRDQKPEVHDLTKRSILRWQNTAYTPSSWRSTLCFNGNPDYEPSVQDSAETPIPRWQNMLSFAASLYPVYVTVGGIVACINPSSFSWFVKRGPSSYSFSLGLIMLAMGLTLELRDLLNLFKQRPLSILAGCVAQYTIMPSLGVVISKLLALPPALSVGLILLAACPGGTASNVVTLIARGDVPLSILMTMCSTLAAVVLTPLLTLYLAGTYVPIDPVKLSISTLQVVVAPVLLGSFSQSTFPAAVKAVIPFAPLCAVLVSSLLASSVFSENVIRLRSSMASGPFITDLAQNLRLQAILSSELGLTVLAVLLLHCAGFFVGYIAAAIAGFQEPQRRAISIEVGMQNSSLGVVLAASHFSSPLVALPPALSAVIMNIIGSSLAFMWRNIDPENRSEST